MGMVHSNLCCQRGSGALLCSLGLPGRVALGDGRQGLQASLLPVKMAKAEGACGGCW